MMIGECPRCELKVELPISGAYVCQRCRQQFEVFLTDPAAVRAQSRTIVPPLSPATPFTSAQPVPAGGHCAAHPSNPATDACERCGDFMCFVCRTAIEGRRYCPRCFELLYSRGSLQFTQMAFRLPAYALSLGIVSLVSLPCIGGCYGMLSVPSGIIAIILGGTSLREIGRRPDLPGRGQAIWGIVCGVLGVLVTLWLGAWVVWMFMEQARRGGR
jgi:hypothetical protein